MPDILARQRTIIGTTAEWAANDLVIGYGEIALEVDASEVKIKVGDGISAYSVLKFIGASVTQSDLATRVPLSRQVATSGGLEGGGNLSQDRTLSIAPTSNGFGTRTVSAAQPSGGNNGDIWYVV